MLFSEWLSVEHMDDIIGLAIFEDKLKDEMKQHRHFGIFKASLCTFDQPVSLFAGRSKDLFMIDYVRNFRSA